MKLVKLVKLVTLINFTQPVNGYKDTFIFIGLLSTYFSL